MTKTWMVRAGKGGEHIDAFLEQGFVGFGYGSRELGGLPQVVAKDAITAAFKAANPQWSAGKVSGAAGQLFRFLSDIKEGDTVVSGDPGRRSYYVGVITGPPRFEDGEAYAFRRAVKWGQRVARDELSVPTLNTLGAIQSLFRLSAEVAKELAEHERPIEEEVKVGEKKPGKPPNGRTTDVVPEELLAAPEKAKAFIEDMINRLDWDELQQLVAGVLRAMGYKTRVSPPGPDRGVDIFASPDGLGLQEPRIFVEVKHREASMGAPDLRAFLGGRKTGDKCLYVSTGGFRKDARYEADRSTIPITLVALPELRDLLLEHYDKLDEETRSLVALRRVYLPFDRNE